MVAVDHLRHLDQGRCIRLFKGSIGETLILGVHFNQREWTGGQFNELRRAVGWQVCGAAMMSKVAWTLRVVRIAWALAAFPRMGRVRLKHRYAICAL